MTKEQYMEEALKQAKIAFELDEVPVGAIIVKDDKIIAKAYNYREHSNLATDHAEIRAINQAEKYLNTWRLEGCDLYVTLEPCPLCAGACIQSKIRKVYYGALDQKAGSVDSVAELFMIPQYNHHPESEGGIMKSECAKILSDYFQLKRQIKK